MKNLKCPVCNQSLEIYSAVALEKEFYIDADTMTIKDIENTYTGLYGSYELFCNNCDKSVDLLLTEEQIDQLDELVQSNC